MPTILNRHIGPIGYGMNGLTHPAKNVSQEDAISLLKTALENGANLWNAGEIYGTPSYNSLHLLNAYFTKYPEDADRVVISVKACFDMKAAKARTDVQGVRESVEHCLKVLDGKCRIDIFEAARLDPDVSVEETVGAIAEFVKQGKVGGVGLSECSAASIRKAVQVCAIAAVEVEVSLFETSIFSNGVAEACKEHGIPIVAYSPLSKGFLTGQLTSFDDLPENDYRRMFPRFQKDVFDENLKLVDALKKIANREDCTVVQSCLAWLCAQSERSGIPIIPIPGATKASRVEENTTSVQLSSEEMTQIDEMLEKIEVKGARAPSQFSRFLEV